MASSQLCQICNANPVYTTVTKFGIGLPLLQDVVVCNLQEILMPGKRSLTNVCYVCASVISRSAFTIRCNSIFKKNATKCSTVEHCSCHICKNDNENRYYYMTDLNKTLRAVVFKLTGCYLDRGTGPYVIYFCGSCYRLVQDMNYLLEKFYDPRLSK